VQRGGLSRFSSGGGPYGFCVNKCLILRSKLPRLEPSPYKLQTDESFNPIGPEVSRPEIRADIRRKCKQATAETKQPETA
jgi:hypothetical protein